MRRKMRRIAKEMAKAGKQFIPPKKAPRSRKAMCAPAAALATVVQQASVDHPVAPSASFSLDLLANAALMVPPIESIAVKNSAERRYPLEHSYCRENVIEQLKSWAAASPRNLEFTGFPQRPLPLPLQALPHHDTSSSMLGIFAESAIESEKLQGHGVKRHLEGVVNKENDAMAAAASVVVPISVTSPRKRRRCDLTLPPPIPGMPMPIVAQHNTSLHTSGAADADTGADADAGAATIREGSGSSTPDRSLSEQHDHDGGAHSPSETTGLTHMNMQEGIIAANISPPGDTISAGKKFWSPDSSPGTTPVQPERTLSYPLPIPPTAPTTANQKAAAAKSFKSANLANDFTLRRSQRERGVA